MLREMIYSVPFLLQGLLVTIEVSLMVVSISLVIGLILGCALIFGPWPLRIFVRILSDTVRGIPVLVLLFFVYYGSPAVGLELQSFSAAVTALTLFKTAHVIEYARGAIQSIPKGQSEAAQAIGLTFRERLIYVIFPQAVRRFLPPWINGVTDAVKGSALVSLLGVVDLMKAVNQVIGRTYEAMPLYILGALIYFAINYSLSSLSRRLERRFSFTQA